jgi:hypothetical protein
LGSYDIKGKGDRLFYEGVCALEVMAFIAKQEGNNSAEVDV